MAKTKVVADNGDKKPRKHRKDSALRDLRFKAFSAGRIRQLIRSDSKERVAIPASVKSIVPDMLDDFVGRIAQSCVAISRETGNARVNHRVAKAALLQFFTSKGEREIAGSLNTFLATSRNALLAAKAEDDAKREAAAAKAQ